MNTFAKRRSVDDAILSAPRHSLWADAGYRLIRNKAAVVGAVVVLLFILMAALAPVVAPHDPLQINDGKGYLPPWWAPEWTNTTGKSGESQFFLGTDSIGRDVLSRVIYGARVSIVVAFVPTTITLIIGVLIGLISGYLGGWVDTVLMRFTDIVFAFPGLLFFIIVMVALRDSPLGNFMNGLLLLFGALSIVNWVGIARLVRGQVLSLKEKEFIEAAHAIGAPDMRIISHHILPNCLGPIIVSAAFAIPGNIVTEAILGFLGLGLRPGTDPREFFVTSWGSLLLQGRSDMNSQPWLLLAPALCVGLVVMAFTFLGDGLRDALDPRMRGNS